MPYENFMARVIDTVVKAGGNLSVRFKNDTEHGRFFANISDGTTIIGRPDCLKVTVRFGSGHQAMAEL